MTRPAYDVIVIGGGPAGSTLASLAAMQGHRVLLLEKARFPRHQIGESLLPSTVHGICRLIGAQEEVERAGFMRKRGGTFLWGRSATPWTFVFSEREDSPNRYAFQVERARFDQILLDNAARLGATVCQETSVTEVTFEDGRVSGVRYQSAAGAQHSATARFVVDAAGNQSPFHRLVGRRVLSKFFQNIALYGYFQHGRRLPPPNSGNILCAAFPGGWFWYIPLSDVLTSVGAVVSKETAAEALKQGREMAFQGFVEQCPLIREYLRDATRVTEGAYGEFRVRSDYSYCNSAFHRQGLFLIGDAACFVDPVLSSGVHLATYAALLAARTIGTCLAADAAGHERPSEADCVAEFEYRYRLEYWKFYEFLAAFYDMHHDESSYFWKARKVLKTDAAPRDAFVSLVAGLSQEDDPVFARDPILTGPTHDGLGECLESAVAQRRLAGPRSGKASSEVHGFDFDTFLPGLSTEMTQLQTQAYLGRLRPPESPVMRGGLVPSPDGLHWVRASAAPPGGRLTHAHV